MLCLGRDPILVGQPGTAHAILWLARPDPYTIGAQWHVTEEVSEASATAQEVVEAEEVVVVVMRGGGGRQEAATTRDGGVVNR